MLEIEVYAGMELIVQRWLTIKTMHKNWIIYKSKLSFETILNL